MQTPPTPHKEASDAAEKIHYEYSTEWWNTVAMRQERFKEFYFEAQERRDEAAQIITASYSATIARKDDLLLEARRQLKNAQHQYHCSFPFKQESTPFDSIVTAIENELKGSGDV